MSVRVLLEVLAFVGDWTVKATMLMAAAWAVAAALRPHPAVGHLVRVTAFAGLLLIPVLGFLVPSYSVPVVRVTPSDARPSTPSEPAPPASDGPSEAGVTRGAFVPGVLVALWIAGVAAVGFRWAVAFAAVGALRRRSIPTVRHGLDVSALRARVGLERPCEVRTSLAASPPTAITWGLVRPTVLLPTESASWSRERLEAVVLHELAHVRRRDSASRALALCACALQWFNPAVWLGARAMREDAERATDDAVLLAGVRPSDYAAELLSIAAGIGLGRRFATPGASVVDRSRIQARIESIVDARPRRAMSRADALRAVGLGACATLLLVSLRLTAAYADPQHASPDVRPSPLAQLPRERRDGSVARPADVLDPSVRAERGRERRHDRGGSARANSPDLVDGRSVRSSGPATGGDVLTNPPVAGRPSVDSGPGSDTVDGLERPRGPSEDVRRDAPAPPGGAERSGRSADVRPDAVR
jgi:beta-lactamase regulating signal transducer with metallopeptidase domain